MALQLSQIVEGVHPAVLAGVDEAHVEVSFPYPVLSFLEERVFAMKNRLLQGALGNVVVQWDAGLA
jgi:hypothetical protein